MIRRCLALLLLAFSVEKGWAAQAGRLYIRVTDVGAGLCCVVATPDGHYMVYDAGTYADRGRTAMSAIEDLIPYGANIDLLVVSHGDADHLAAVPYICENYRVKEVWRDGLVRTTDTWRRADAAIRAESTVEGCIDRNLQATNMTPGFSANVGAARVTFLCGFAAIPTDWGLISEGEDRNARSVVVRLDYGESSVLFSGDTVGRHIGDDDDVCIAAEAFLVDNQEDVSVDVDVTIAPHHGADNGSSGPFVEAMSPRYVIFSSGSDHHHPHRRAVGRYLNAGVPLQNIFRTDRGDNEGAPEWRPRSGARRDRAGDDDIEVGLALNGHIQIGYAPLGISPIVPTPFAATAPILGGVGHVSPQIAKWINDDSLWQESYPDLEKHTEEPAASSPSVQAVLADPPPRHAVGAQCCRLRGRLLEGRMRPWWRIICRR